MKRSTSRLVPMLVAVAVFSSACVSSGPGRLEFGIRRLALNIAFVDEDAAPPPEPNVVIRLVPAPPEYYDPDFDFRKIPADDGDPEPFLACATVSPDATVAIAASPSIIDPPLPGPYLRRNSGTIEIQGASLPLRLPYPLLSVWTISPTTKVTRPGPLGTPGTAAANQFTVTKALSPTYTVTETYEMAPEALLLIERVTNSSGVITQFRTDPPVEFFHFGAEGDKWRSAGADVENGYGVVIQGSIADRVVIDVCGTLVDTFAISYVEQVVNLANGETSGTNESTPSTIYFAPQYGGLVVREDMHTIQRTAAPDGSPLVIRFDYLSTLTGVTPSKA